MTRASRDPIECVARGLRASRDRRLNGKDDEIVRELAIEALWALDALEADLAAARDSRIDWQELRRADDALAAARRENATLRRQLDELMEEARLLVRAASPAAQEPQP